MIKVMIVEDEYLIRELIKESIEWEQYGFKIVAEAEDGDQAIEMLETVDPQLLLVDINMPFVNGLELAEIIRARYSQIKVILLTGYSEFEYAKRALQSGVLSYILKPIDEHELLSALIEARKIIIENEDHSDYLDLLETQTQTNIKNSRDKYLHSLINQNKYSTDEIREKAAYYHFRLQDSYLRSIVIEIDYFQGKVTTPEDEKIWLFAVSNMAEDIFRENHQCEIFIDNNTQIVMILNVHEIDRKNHSDTHLNAACQKLQQLVEDYLGFSLSFGVSQIHNGFLGVHESYKEAILALQNKFSSGSHKILHYDTKTNTEEGFDFLVFEKKDQLLYHLRRDNDTSYIGIIDQIYKELRMKRIEKEYIQIITIELVAIAIAFITENHGKIEKLFESRRSCIEEIKQKNTIDEVQNWLIDVYKRSQQIIINSEEKKSSKIANEIKSFIDENYMRSDLSLEEIAQTVHMNASYISTLFKKEAGCSITEYARHVRMTKAKELIDIKQFDQISTIADYVGFTDPYYFSKCFKKHFGVTTSEYINKK